MKKFLIALAIGSIILNGCDIVEAPYKKDNIQIDSKRKVLLEDYTGHQCPNCPKAGQIIHDLMEDYSENVVVIAVHSGTLAKLLVPPTLYNFTTETGDVWCDYFAIEAAGFPNGLINRKERSGNKIIAPNNWPAVVAELAAQQAEAEIQLVASYNETTREIQVSASTNIASPKSGESYFLTVVVTEDSIIKPQKNSDVSLGTIPYITNYPHMHVLRFSMTGHWGVSINPTIIDQKSFNKVLDAGSDINPGQCRIVAFISNSNKEVLQAEEVHLVP